MVSFIGYVNIRLRLSTKKRVTKALSQYAKVEKAKLKRLCEILPTTDFTVTLNGVMKLPYCLDSGSDHTIIGRSDWEQLIALEPDGQVEHLEFPA
ncbi:Hypothetical protein PHPALM_9348 [Phytophthora palmivora]|uniref:Uncharacterized protein n=1 Tax=Phytophthora palmivora TaxID=4796 RepID=A0A2P4Y7H7_9STRA|nr:Hypothetical protein PHPALM_9348 [Phytophthora palmivora]